jgi:DNA-binding response OmpR family regulator
MTDVLTILVVEDNPAVAELLRTVLNDVSGWGATVVHNAAAALAVFSHIHVDVLILDINLPGISGLDLLSLLRQNRPWQVPPVILVSANPTQAGIREALEEGEAVRFIAKPFDVDELVHAVHTAVAEAVRAKGAGAQPGVQ